MSREPGPCFEWLHGREISRARETDGRWLAEIGSLPGALAYGTTSQEAARKVNAFALRILAERLEYEENSSLERDFRDRLGARATHHRAAVDIVLGSLQRITAFIDTIFDRINRIDVIGKRQRKRVRRNPSNHVNPVKKPKINSRFHGL